jgi:lysophospholipase L1-like esterase
MHYILSFVLFFAMPALGNSIIIGDSIFALTKAVPNNLKKEGYEFTLLAKSGALTDEIAEQYERYVEEYGVPDTVLYNGGGNDILFKSYGACYKHSDSCYRYVDSIIRKGLDLVKKMQEDGVRQVIYVGLHYLGPMHTRLNKIIDYGMDTVAVEASTLHIKFIDIREPFSHKWNERLWLLDDVHPNIVGSKIISDRIAAVLDEDERKYGKQKL